MWYLDNLAVYRSCHLPLLNKENTASAIHRAEYPMCHLPVARMTVFCQCFLISAIPTRCSPNSISTLHQTNPTRCLHEYVCSACNVLNLKLRSVSKPYTGIFIFLHSIYKRKNQLFLKTSVPLSTRLFCSSCLMERWIQVFQLWINCSSASLLRCMMRILSPSGMVILPLSVGLVSNPP